MAAHHVNRPTVQGRTFDTVSRPPGILGHAVFHPACQDSILDIRSSQLIGPHFFFGVS
jgi:hypothetical protein